MQELFKELFDSLPHVNRIWVDANMNAYIHPKKGCEVVDREVAKPKADEGEAAESENSKPIKKGKK